MRRRSWLWSWLVAARPDMRRTALFTALLTACLTALLGAPSVLLAQVDTLQRDTTRTDPAALARDSLRADSLRADSILFENTRRAALRAADTIKAPLARLIAPPTAETFGRRRWTRDEIMQTGAMNLADLLDAVPGITTFRTAWFPGVHTAAFQGDFRRVRVFFDGLEVDAPEIMNNGVLDLTEISLAALDEVVVERSAGEVRVWLTSWTVTSVTPYSRTDIFTGDLNTNGFRGLFGRRFMNGALFQLTLQQGETARRRGVGGGGFGAPTQRAQSGDGDVRQLTARTGWARGLFSVDAHIMNTSRSRDPSAGTEESYLVPGYDGARTEAYLRAGYGNPNQGFSAQVLINRMTSGPRQDSADNATEDPTDDPEDDPPAPPPDSSRSISQRFAYAGYAHNDMRIGAFARWREYRGQSIMAPGVRASIDRGWLTATVHGERVGLDSSRRIDANVRANLRPWLVVSAAHSDLAPDDGTGRLPEQTSRVGGAIGWNGRWLSGAFIRQQSDAGSRLVILPRMLTPFADELPAPTLAGFTGNGLSVGADMPLYKDLRLELHGTRWNTPREYLPQTHVRASFILESDWLSRFPKGHFSINARLINEYRSGVSFIEPSLASTANPFRTSDAYNLGIALLEIRILRATIFYQFRNVYGGDYAQVPGIPMPPPFQMYGVRWEWFN